MAMGAVACPAHRRTSSMESTEEAPQRATASVQEAQVPLRLALRAQRSDGVVTRPAMAPVNRRS